MEAHVQGRSSEVLRSQTETRSSEAVHAPHMFAEHRMWMWGVPFVFGVLAYRTCRILCKTIKIRGVDMHKQSKPELPEGVGLGAGVCFICAMFCLCSGFPEHKEALLMSACTVALNLLLGYVDDTIELGWGSKIMFPWVSLFPIVMAYNGSTEMVVPWVGRICLGWVFYVMLFGLSIFFTNAVNILSGINGVESGQVLVISGFMAVDRMIFRDEKSHLAALLSMCLCACTLGVFVLNRYPAKCFVGDTFCYFSGAAVLCLGVLGGFTKTVFLFFLPQIANFVISLPQLSGIVPCPRHRLPQMVIIDKKEMLVPSMVLIDTHSDKSSRLHRHPKVRQVLLRAVQVLRMARLTPRPRSLTNLTLLNCILLHTGPISEPALCTILLVIQGSVCCGVILLKIFAEKIFCNTFNWLFQV